MAVQDNKYFRLLLLGFALFALLFQLVGLFTQGWVVIKIHGSFGSYDIYEEMDIGLWTMNHCRRTDGEDAHRLVRQDKCEVFSFNRFLDSLPDNSHSNVAVKSLNQEMTKAQALATTAVLMALGSLMSTLFIFIDRFVYSVQLRRLVSCIMSTGSAVLTLVAVVCSGQLNSFFTYVAEYMNQATLPGGSNFSVLFPWSLFITGVGMGFSAICGAMVAFLMCFDDQLPRKGRCYNEAAETSTQRPNIIRL